MNKYYVYIYVNVKDMVPFYVGKGTKGRWRPQSHQYKTQPLLVNKIRKIGVNNILICLPFKGLSHATALIFERMLVDIYGRKDLGIGTLLNLTNGGDGLEGYKHSEKTRKKMSKAQRKRVEEGTFISTKYWKGKRRSTVDRAKISKTLKGRTTARLGTVHSAASKQKMSIAAKKRAPMTDETRKKLSKSVKKSWVKRKELKK